MTIASVSRARGRTATVQRELLRPHNSVFRVDGGLPCAAVAGVATAASAVREAPTAALVVPEARPIIVSPVASAERTILERFLADLAVAPDLAGELVALYVEEHPLLTLRFVTAALEFDRMAALAIAAAAARREAHGLRTLALVLLGALALTAPPAPELDTPPVILDIADESDWDFPW
jgi:hypothetical protein